MYLPDPELGQRIAAADHVQLLKRDDGSIKNIYLIDKANSCNISGLNQSV